MLEPRHGHGHHNHRANVKYGYYTLLASIAYIGVIATCRYIYAYRWQKQGRPGTRGVWRAIVHTPFWVHLLLWFAIYLVLLFVGLLNFPKYYAGFLKRTGRVAYCLVPLDVILAFRPALFGGSGYLEHIPFHKWLLRIILFGTTIHGLGFFVKWLIEHRFWDRFFDIYNVLGEIPTFLAVLLAVVLARPIRAKVYGFFYIWHNATVVSFATMIIVHARPGVTDIAILTIVLCGVQVYLRVSRTYRLPKITIVDKDQLALRVLKLTKPTHYPAEWSAGSHLRLTTKMASFTYWLLPSHPYTIALLPLDDSVVLVVKKTFRFQVFSSVDYTITLPYMSLPPPFFKTAENVHILCGGSGISMGVPLYRYFSTNSSVVANLTWCISNKEDDYVLDELTVPKAMDIYVTGSQSSTLFVNNGETEQYGLLDEADNFELQSLSSDESEDPNPFADTNAVRKKPGVSYHKGRPIFDEIFRPFGETDDAANKWLIVCGPPGMIQDAKKWGRQHKVQVFSELYEM